MMLGVFASFSHIQSVFKALLHSREKCDSNYLDSCPHVPPHVLSPRISPCLGGENASSAQFHVAFPVPTVASPYRHAPCQGSMHAQGWCLSEQDKLRTSITMSRRRMGRLAALPLPRLSPKDPQARPGPLVPGPSAQVLETSEVTFLLVLRQAHSPSLVCVFFRLRFFFLGFSFFRLFLTPPPVFSYLALLGCSCMRY